MPSRSPTTTKVGGSSDGGVGVRGIGHHHGRWFWKVVTTPYEPIDAAILAPAELPQSE